MRDHAMVGREQGAAGGEWDRPNSLFAIRYAPFAG
jgi:hypothetical protein